MTCVVEQLTAAWRDVGHKPAMTLVASPGLVYPGRQLMVSPYFFFQKTDDLLTTPGDSLQRVTPD